MKDGALYFIFSTVAIAHMLWGGTVVPREISGVLLWVLIGGLIWGRR